MSLRFLLLFLVPFSCSFFFFLTHGDIYFLVFIVDILEGTFYGCIMPEVIEEGLAYVGRGFVLLLFSL